MADEEKEYSEEEEEDNEGADKEPHQKISEAELAMEKMRKKKEEEEAYWTEYLEQRTKQRAKEEDELKKLKERQVKRKERRKDEETKLMALRKSQEEQRIREMEENKARDAEAKRKRLEEAERKRQAMQEALQKKVKEPVTPNYVITKKNEDGTPGALVHAVFDKFSDIAMTKEQLLEDKKIALSVRVKPLQIEGLTVLELRQKAQELWDAIVRLESEKYDLEERRKRQEYDLKELSERQKQINRSNALKKGLDPDALSGKYPPMIQVASKYERRLDRRSFHDKKSLYEGGLEKAYENSKDNKWEEKVKNFQEKGPSKLLKWDPNAPKVKEEGKTRGEDEEEEEMPLSFGEGKAEDDSEERQAKGGEEEEEEEEEEDEEEEEEEEE